MLSIVGKQIYLHYGDDSAFRIVYPNEYGELVSFDPEDMITLSVMNLDDSAVILMRQAESVSVNGVPTTAFNFTPEDFDLLTPNNYIYTLVLETSVGFRYTLVDRAYLSILKSAYKPGLFDARRAVTYSSRDSHISDISLVCDFDYKSIQKDPVDGTLILFNRVTPPAIDDDQEDDTLILFSEREEEDIETEDSTLIIF